VMLLTMVLESILNSEALHAHVCEREAVSRMQNYRIGVQTWLLEEKLHLTLAKI